ncbi:hypothetical protein FHS42_005701 [Streptomyces zagrosensis]|uniref:Uncharacterized protein n=1 Tax=Streptomyces zagrosensis TaxID=1042984 RepID=A0A7W9V159_9ACTN|nr:hypothetical protein [Streptomyces zagrosensis]
MRPPAADLALWAGDLLGVPIDGEGFAVEDAALAGLANTSDPDRSDQADTVLAGDLLLERDGEVAAVDEVLLRQLNSYLCANWVPVRDEPDSGSSVARTKLATRPNS